MKLEANLEPKLFYLGIFRLVFEKQIIVTLEATSNFQNAKFHEKLKILRFGTKITLFGCFGQQFVKTIVKFEMNTQNKKLEMWDQKYLT